MIATPFLDQVIEPLAECMTPEAAQKIVNMKADAALQSRVDELAEKANLGTLTESERSEYDHYLSAFHLVTMLQTKARRILKP